MSGDARARSNRCCVVVNTRPIEVCEARAKPVYPPHEECYYYVYIFAYIYNTSNDPILDISLRVVAMFFVKKLVGVTAPACQIGMPDRKESSQSLSHRQ